jgi:hypothetical protein
MMKQQMTPPERLDNRRVLWLQLIGRFKPGVTARGARASLNPTTTACHHGDADDAVPLSSAAASVAAKTLILIPAYKGVSTCARASEPLLILPSIVGLLLLTPAPNANLPLAAPAAKGNRRPPGRRRRVLVRQLVPKASRSPSPEEPSAFRRTGAALLGC